MPAVTTTEHRTQAALARRLLAAHARSEDLIRIGAYQKGADPTLDRAVEIVPQLNLFLNQRPEDIVAFPDVVKSLLEVPN